jgi:hypothetical protein
MVKWTMRLERYLDNFVSVYNLGRCVKTVKGALMPLTSADPSEVVDARGSPEKWRRTQRDPVEYAAHVRSPPQSGHLVGQRRTAGSGYIDFERVRLLSG